MELVFEELFELPQDPGQPERNGKFLVVVIYDVADNKRRLKIAKTLKGYGKRVQKSAFECIINRKQYDTMIQKLVASVDETDLLRVYRIAGSADVKVWGDVALTTLDEDMIV